VARQTGTGVHQAAVTLETGKQLEGLPAVRDAFTTGRITQAQVTEIAPAATASPADEQRLVAVAEDTKRHGDGARHRPAGQGVGHRSAGASQPGAPRARVADLDRSGRDLAPRPGALFVNVDAQKLTGGDPAQGVCEIKGVGPVPVAAAKELMGDALLTILVKKGVDVSTIAHDGTKTMPAALRRSVLARDPECVVDICSAPTSEVHHIEQRSDGGVHSTKNCVGTCGWCHDLIHYHGYTLEPNGDGTYHLRAPPD
jgi:hypothetical protein